MYNSGIQISYRILFQPIKTVVGCQFEPKESWRLSLPLLWKAPLDRRLGLSVTSWQPRDGVALSLDTRHIANINTRIIKAEERIPLPKQSFVDEKQYD